MAHELELPIGIEPSKAEGIELENPKKLNISDELVSTYWTEAFRKADDIRQPREVIWDSAWSLYNGEYDWSGKEEWQAQINIPKVREAVDTATGTFERALIKMKRFYQIESETKLGIQQGLFTINLMDYWLDQIGFVNEFSEGLKNGLITSTIIYKVWWNWVTTREPRWVEKTKKEDIVDLGIKVGTKVIPFKVITKDPRVEGRLGVKAIPSYNMWVGPRDSYHIEKATVDLAYLFKLADKGIYDKEAVEQLSSRSGALIEKQQEARRKGENASRNDSFIREVELFHYWGDIYSDDGKILAHNATFTIADEDVVLRKPETNPFFHGKAPYVIGTPYKVPFSIYNRGLVEDIIGIAKMITELSCLIIDGAQFDAMQAYEIDTDLLADPRQVKRGVYPGVAFGVKSYENPTTKNVVRNITTGKIPNLALNVLGFLDQEQQLSTSIPNSLKGQPIGGSETLGEFQGLTAAATANLDNAARTVEKTTLDPMLDMIAKTAYQYHVNYTLPRFLENFPQTSVQLSQMSPEERYATMVGDFKFRARGVSIFLDKAQDLQKVMRFIELISNVPGAMESINMDNMLEQVVISLGWNPQDILPNLGNDSGQGDPSAILAGQPQGSRSNLTPAQITNGQKGAQLGGARNNPNANPNTRKGAVISPRG